VTVKNVVFLLRRVALIRTDDSEERIASIINVLRLLVIAKVVPSSPILVTLMMKAISSSETSGFLQESHGVTSQKTAFLTVS
jgi:hypothetical protein